jgi:hypothetical protein
MGAVLVDDGRARIVLTREKALEKLRHRPASYYGEGRKREPVPQTLVDGDQVLGGYRIYVLRNAAFRRRVTVCENSTD